MKAILRHTATLIVILSTSYASFSQTISREVLMEDTLHSFDVSYNLTQKLIDSTTIHSTSVQNQQLFRQFIKGEMRGFFMSNYSKLVSGIITSYDLLAAYDDHFNSLKNSVSLMSNFNSWKIQHQHVNSHSHSHTAEAGN